MEPFLEPPVEPDQARRAADEILSRAEYQPRPRSVLSRVVDWILERLRLPSTPAQPTTSGRLSPAAIAVLVLLAAVVAYLLYRLVRSIYRDGFRLRRRRSSDDEVEITPDPAAGPQDWADEADRLEAAGLLREALRARYRATLGRLSSAGWLRPLPGSSPGELSAELAGVLPPAARPFDQLTERFQAVWYGAAPIDGAASHETRRRAEEVVAASTAAGPAPPRARGTGADPDDDTDDEDIDTVDIDTADTDIDVDTVDDGATGTGADGPGDHGGAR